MANANTGARKLLPYLTLAIKSIVLFGGARLLSDQISGVFPGYESVADRCVFFLAVVACLFFVVKPFARAVGYNVGDREAERSDNAKGK